MDRNDFVWTEGQGIGQKLFDFDLRCLQYYRVFHVAGILEVVEEQKITDVNLKSWIQCLEEGHQARIYVSKHTQTKVEGYVAVRYQFDWMNQAWTTKMRNKKYKYSVKNEKYNQIS